MMKIPADSGNEHWHRAWLYSIPIVFMAGLTSRRHLLNGRLPILWSRVCRERREIGNGRPMTFCRPYEAGCIGPYGF